MKSLGFILLFAWAFFAVFFQSAFNGFRYSAGAQIDLLPPLMVFAGIRMRMIPMALLAIWCGFLLDGVSQNPLGSSMIPLFLAGWAVNFSRAWLIQDLFYTQFLMGFVASTFVPFFTLLTIVAVSSIKGLPNSPDLHWGLLARWMIVAVTGGILTPIIFKVFDKTMQALLYQTMPDSRFRVNREIVRRR